MTAAKKMTETTKPCYACETGTVRPANLRGTTLAYRDEPDLVIDRDVVVPRCDTCGEMWLQARDTAKLNDVLEALRLVRKRQAAEGFVSVVERRYPEVPRAAWEDLFGLSRGYLSRLISGKKVADTPLELWLFGFAQQPDAVLLLLGKTRPLPSAVAAALHRSSSRVQHA
jgi:hypothetical protein